MLFLSWRQPQIIYRHGWLWEIALLIVLWPEKKTKHSVLVGYILGALYNFLWWYSINIYIYLFFSVVKRVNKNVVFIATKKLRLCRHITKENKLSLNNGKKSWKITAIDIILKKEIISLISYYPIFPFLCWKNRYQECQNLFDLFWLSFQFCEILMKFYCHYSRFFSECKHINDLIVLGSNHIVRNKIWTTIFILKKDKTIQRHLSAFIYFN